jgi:signal transduction histidine kinase
MRWLRGLPIFWQTLGLTVAAVALAQLVFWLLLIVNPPPGPQFNRLGDVAAELRGQAHDHSERERGLLFRNRSTPPEPHASMVADPALTHAFAERAGFPDDKVRLFFEPDTAHLHSRRWPREPVLIRRGETLLFTPIVAGIDTGHGWRVAETPLPPLIAPWQWRMALWLGLSALAMIPLAWAFARALTRPIRRFAEAAERLGGDPLAPAVREEGPAELRTTARALNTMQARVAGYVGERTEMIGAIAHDLRTPLARIAFRVEGAPEPIREKVLGDVEQMRAMLAATIGFVRNTAAPMQHTKIDLTALLAALIAQDRDFGRDVTLAPSPMATVQGDPMMLERMFQNLVDNGVTYGGAVTVTIERADSWAFVRVADNGPGLSTDMLERAFRPFVRGEPSRNRSTGGIGLGLTIARTIAEDHGGGIALANGEGGGLVATVRLPAAT